MTGLLHSNKLALRETFVPILYVFKCQSVEEAIGWNNEVEYGLSSSLFTQSVDKVFKWMG